MPDPVCKRCFVRGRVQGVFFRAATANCARELGITGSAVNLPDGRVEVVAYGDESDVAKLCDWLWQGPVGASVTHVECSVVEYSQANDLPGRFTTG